MAKPTTMQNYYLGQFRVARVFGLVFAVGSVLIAISNIPELLRTGDAGDWATILAAGIGFAVIGTLLFIVARRGNETVSRLRRRPNRHKNLPNLSASARCRDRPSFRGLRR